MENQDLNKPQAAPDNNLVWAILCTILCCLPAGVYAIIRATKVNTLWMQGDYDGAQKAAADAKKWSIIGAIVGAIIIVLYIILVFVLGMAGIAAGRH